MAKTPPTPNNKDAADDWQPDMLQGSGKGQWENDDDATTGNTHNPRPSGSIMGSMFGPLWNDSRARPLFLISMFMLLGVCALGCFIISLLIVGGGSGTGIVSIFGNGAPAAPTGVAPPITDTVNVAINGTAVAPGVPTRLTVGDKVFNVIGLRLNEKGEWPEYDSTNAKAAYWAGGTLVNYVIGLPANDDNKALFAKLKPRDLIALESGVGTLRYRVAKVDTMQVDDPAPLREQTSARITLVLIGDSGATRRIVVAPFTDEGTPNQPAANGVPVNLGDVQVTALEERLIPGNSVGLPAGKNYYQVNLQVTSLVTKIIDASQFFTELNDGAQNKYAVSPQASAAAGAAGWAQGALQPGGTITVTAGFEVPENMPGPTLLWMFAVDKNTPYVASVAIPYKPLSVQPTGTPPPVKVADVNILNANISPEGNELRIVGTVRNVSDKTLTVQLSDLQLVTAAGVPHAVINTLPPIPWSIGPGQELAFQVSFQRPPPGTGSVYFVLFNETFEIPGL